MVIAWRWNQTAHHRVGENGEVYKIGMYDNESGFKKFNVILIATVALVFD